MEEEVWQTLWHHFHMTTNMIPQPLFPNILGILPPISVVNTTETVEIPRVSWRLWSHFSCRFFPAHYWGWAIEEGSLVNTGRHLIGMGTNDIFVVWLVVCGKPWSKPQTPMNHEVSSWPKLLPHFAGSRKQGFKCFWVIWTKHPFKPNSWAELTCCPKELL